MRSIASFSVDGSRARCLATAALWLLLLALVGEFVLTIAHKYGSPDPAAYGMFWSRREWLWLHVAGGIVTALLGPLQFWTRLRTARPRLHRWTGRIYLLALSLAGAGFVGLIATSPAGDWIRGAFASTGVAWIVTASFGFFAIRRGRVEPHRRWMMRNYTVTLAPIAFRAVIAAPGVLALGPPAVLIPSLLVASWLVPLLALEAWLALARRRRATRRPARLS